MLVSLSRFLKIRSKEGPLVDTQRCTKSSTQLKSVIKTLEKQVQSQKEDKERLREMTSNKIRDLQSQKFQDGKKNRQKISDLEEELQKLKLENTKKLLEVQKENEDMKAAIKTLVSVSKILPTFECTICLEDIEEENQVVFSPCGHRKASKMLKLVYKSSPKSPQ